ncbi:hypothetical protein TNCV_180651 [Trichonephila clavipes]|nr:hypothetical protein TNCV_180651 [Trichonephila clavipes]
MPNNHTAWQFMTAVDFLHQENPPTWAEPATLDADGQRQTNYVTQSALAELIRFLLPCYGTDRETWYQQLNLITTEDGLVLIQSREKRVRLQIFLDELRPRFIYSKMTAITDFAR